MSECADVMIETTVMAAHSARYLAVAYSLGNLEVAHSTGLHVVDHILRGEDSLRKYCTQ